MNCKNCQQKLPSDATFCYKCGAEIIDYRSTLKTIFNDFYNKAFGWDNKFVITLKALIIKPQEVLNDYLDGVRKRYAKPFTSFAIGAAISLFVFTIFQEEYLSLIQNGAVENVELPTEELPIIKGEGDIVEPNNNSFIGFNEFLLKYWTLFSFLLLPIYALMTFIVFRKPHNYGEHLIINAYLQGVTFVMLTIIILLSIFISPKLQLLNVLMVIYYVYAFAKFYQQNWKQILWSLLKFILLFIVIQILMGSMALLVTQFVF